MIKKFSGSGGLFGGGGPTKTDDNLFSADIVEAVLGISEGKIKGLKNGPRSFLLGDTPLKNVDGGNNFDSFELVIRKGGPLGEEIVSRMGGFGSSTNVATELASNVPVVRQGNIYNIDYIDIRLVINRLLVTKEEDGSSFEHTGKVKIEIKKTNDANWSPIYTTETSPPPQQVSSVNTDVYTELKSAHQTARSPGDRTTYWQAEPPPLITSDVSNAIWFDSNDNGKPYYRTELEWVAFSANYSNSTWTWSETSSWGSDKATKAFVSNDAPGGREQGDYWLYPDQNRVYFFNGTSWIVAGASLSPGSFSGGGSTNIEAGEVSITGKTTTSTVKEFRVPVERIEDDTYQVRVTKTSPNNTAEVFFDVTWESFQEITAQPMQFPNLATAQITARASEQFSSVPQMSGIYEGREVKVPSNYDPETRVYTGFWDGTWKIEYTNNTAFLVNDLVENDRYGLNAYYPVVLNKWDVYEAGVWCDTLTASGVPRFTFNSLIDQPRNCREAVNFMCGTFGGRFFDDGNGMANIRIDKPENASMIFTPENVVDGIFTYSFTEISSRHNDLTVVFKNPQLNYKEDRRRVFNQAHIDKYGRIPLNFVAVGCNSSAEAITRGRYKLITGIGETAIVNFSTNRQGLYLVPYDIILVVDEDMNGGISGRVKSFTSTTQFELRDPVFLETGVDYKVMFHIPDPADDRNMMVVERLIPTGTSGVLTTIHTTTNLPTLPDQAVFSISTVDTSVAPRPFRVTSISESNGNPDNVDIQAVEVNRLKWDFVDGIIEDYEEPEHYDLELGQRTRPVPDLRIRPFVTVNGQNRVYNLFLDWDPSPTRTTSNYKVYMSKDNGPMTLLTETAGLTFEWNDIQPGEYLFSVIAVAPINGAMSDSVPVVIEHRFVGDFRDVGRVIDLRLVDEASENIYARRTPQFTWTRVDSPDHRDYVIRIYDMNGVVMAQHIVRDNVFSYDYQTNKADHSGEAVRNFQIGIAARDQFGAVSPFNILAVNNPPPPVVNVNIEGAIRSAVISWNTTGITDYAGALIWISTENGFTPDDNNLVYNGGGNNFTFVGDADTPYYMRIALYDDFNEADYNVSDQIIFTVENINLDEITEGFDLKIGYLTDPGELGLAARLRELELMLEENASTTLYGHLADWNDRQVIRRQLVSQGARFSEQIEVMSNETDALASQFTLISASVGNNAAAILNEQQARITSDSSIASSINELSTTFNGMTALGRAGFQIAVAPQGVTARYVVGVKVSTTGTDMAESSMFLDVVNGKARVGFKADLFAILNASGQFLSSPFYVSNDSVFIDNAYITNLTASQIASGSILARHMTTGVISTSTLILDGVVITSKILQNAITDYVTTSPSGTTNYLNEESSIGLRAVAIAVNNNGRVAIRCTAYQEKPLGGSSNFGNYYIRIYRGSHPIHDVTYWYDDNFSQPIVVETYDTPGNGTHTYQCAAIRGSGQSRVRFANGVMSLLQLKR